MRRGIGTVALVGTLMAAGTAAIVPAATVRAAQPQSQGVGFGSDWPVYHHDNLGSGVDPSGISFSPATVAWTSTALDGQIYGEPLVQAGRVVAATENNTVYVLAANTGAILWSTHVGAPVPSGNLPCGNVSPTVGITSTPVIDPALGEVFVVADESVTGNGAAHHLVGLGLYSGSVLLDTIVDPPGSHPLYQLQRTALALDAGQVLVGFGGNAGDCETPTNPYHGWLVAAPESGGSMRTFEVAANAGDSQGAIWMGGASPIVDGSGNIWLATGNSAFSSSSDAYDNSDGVIELNSAMVEQQFFAPSAWYSDNGADLDLGSSSPVLMDSGLVFQAGKSKTAYVLSSSSLGGVGGQLASAGSYCGSDVDGGNAVTGNTVYTPCQNGVVKTQVTPGTPPTIASVWQSSTGSGGPPIVAGGLVWTIDSSSGNLYGLDPATGDASQTFGLGSVANHFPTPAAADGLLLAASANKVHAFDGPAGLPPPPPAPTLPYAAVSAAAVSSTDVVVVGRSPTSVLWYQQSTSGVFGGWQSVSTTDVASQPSAVVSGTNLYVFFRATDNELHYFVRAGSTWGTEQNLGGVISGNPAAALDGNGAVIVVALNSAGNVFTNRLPSGGPWTGWTSLAGVLSGQVTLGTLAGNVYLLGVNGSGLGWTKEWTAGSTNTWAAWTALGGVFETGTTLSGAGYGTTLHVQGVNSQGILFEATGSGTTWSGWTPLNGVLAATPSLATTSSSLFVFDTNPAGGLWYQRNTTSWLGWNSLAGVLETGPVSAPAGANAFVFGLNNAGNLWYREWNGSSFGAWTNLGGILATA